MIPMELMLLLVCIFAFIGVAATVVILIAWLAHRRAQPLASETYSKIGLIIKEDLVRQIGSAEKMTTVRKIREVAHGYRTGR